LLEDCLDSFGAGANRVAVGSAGKARSKDSIAAPEREISYPPTFSRSHALIGADTLDSFRIAEQWTGDYTGPGVVRGITLLPRYSAAGRTHLSP